MMATLKAKNNAGEWVDIASATNVIIEGDSSTTGLYIDSIAPITLPDGTHAFDLTKYENCNRFIIIYSAKNTTIPNGGYHKYAYDSANVDGYLKQLVTSATDAHHYGFDALVTGNGDGAKNALFENASSAGNSFTGSVTSYPDSDISNCIFTQAKHVFGNKAIVIYAM